MWDRISQGQFPLTEGFGDDMTLSFFFAPKTCTGSIKSIKMKKYVDGHIECLDTSGSGNYKMMSDDSVRNFWLRYFVDENKYG